MMTRADKIAAAAVLLLALVVYMLFTFALFTDSAEYAVITVDGQEFGRYRLADIKGVREIRVETNFGANIVECTQSAVWVKEADCPDKIDVKTGKITKPNQMLVCIPNRMTVRLTGGRQAVDGVAY